MPMRGDLKVDLFSDTNVNPSAEMRQVMASAQVGNEVAAEDPTVNKLLEKVCLLLNKPAATFMPSGTMCNGVAFRALCQPGDRIVLDHTAHPVRMASGLISGLVGAQPELIQGDRGIFTVEQLKSAIGKNDGYNIAKAKLVSIEQTTNVGGGAIWPLDQLENVCNYAHSQGLSTHMDGARLLNASVASGIAAAQYSQYFDSVWIDFAKGLGAPMGAVIAGSQSFIDRVWFYKFQQGGAMHQAGILAAGCLYALEHNVNRLENDHQNAKMFARLLSDVPGVSVNPELVETNIVIFSLMNSKISAPELVSLLLQDGVRLLSIDDKKIRAIFHMDITIEKLKHVFLLIKALIS